MNEVPFERKDLPIRKLASGHELTIPVFTFQGTDPDAPKVYIQANIHGAEVQGNAVIYQLMEHFKTRPPLSDVILVPFCNPFATNMKMGEYTFGRFDPVTGENWNRGYFKAVCRDEDERQHPSQINVASFVKKNFETPWPKIKELFKQKIYESYIARQAELNKWGPTPLQKLALTLQNMTWDRDIVLDLHTGPKAIRYLYLPEYSESSAVHFGISCMLSIPHEFAGAMDEANFINWCLLKEEYEKIGRTDIPHEFESYTVELGHEESFHMKDAEEDTKGILNYLYHKGAVSEPPANFTIEPQFVCDLKDYVTVKAPMGGLVDYVAKPGEHIEKGAPLCQILDLTAIKSWNDHDQALTTIYAPENGIVVFHAITPAVHEGMSLFNLMIQVRSPKLS